MHCSVCRMKTGLKATARLPASTDYLLGEFLALLTALLWALGVILFKRSVGFVAPFTLNVFKNCVALVLLAATTVALGQTRTLSVSPKDLMLLLIRGAIGMGISVECYFIELR